MKKAEIKDLQIIVTFGGPDFNSCKNLIKNIWGRRFNPHTKYWTIPNNKENESILREAGFDFGDEVQEVEEIDESWRDLDIELPELNKGFEFLEYQKTALKYAQYRNFNTYLGLFMGAGKTLMSVACIMMDPKDRLPALVVCPSPVKIGFQKDIRKFFGDKVQTEILEGGDSIRKYTEDKIYIVNYELLSRAVDKEEIVFKNKKGNDSTRTVLTANKQLKDLASTRFSTLILDEAHRIKNTEAKVLEAVRVIAKPVKYIISMSGTPILSKPSEVWTAMNLVNEKAFPESRYYAFLNRYCDPKSFVVRGRRINTYNGATNTKELNAKLRNSGMLVFNREDYVDLPDVERIVMPLELRDKDGYEAEKQQVLMDIADNPSLALTLFEKLKQAAVKYKMPQVFAFIDYLLEVEEKVLVFCVHRKTVEDIVNKYKKIAVPYNGELSPKQKEENKNKFIEDAKTRIIVGNIASLGTGVDGIQRTPGLRTIVFVELEWTKAIHNQAEARLDRTGFAGSHINIFYLVADGSIENDIVEKLDFKASNFEAVINGKEIEQEDLLGYLKSKYVAEGKRLKKIAENKED